MKFSTEIATDCFRTTVHQSIATLRLVCNAIVGLRCYVARGTAAHIMARERYSSKRKIRINALAHKVGRRMFIATALIAIIILAVLFLKPEVFEVDDAPHHFGHVEKVLPRNGDTPRHYSAELTVIQ
jgi:hypothetical protein